MFFDILGKVPSFEIKEGLSIYESLVLVEYLDEVYPQRPLLPKDPIKKSFDKITVEVAGAVSIYLLISYQSKCEKAVGIRDVMVC